MIVSAALANFVSGQNDFTGSPVSENPNVCLEVATRVPEWAESGALQKCHNADGLDAQPRWNRQQESGPIPGRVALWGPALLARYLRTTFALRFGARLCGSPATVSARCKACRYARCQAVKARP